MKRDGTRKAKSPNRGVSKRRLNEWKKLAGKGSVDERAKKLKPAIESLFDHYLGKTTVRGQVRNSIISRSSARPAGGRRTVEFRAGALPTRADSVRVPALPRRNYIPTLSRLEIE